MRVPETWQFAPDLYGRALKFAQAYRRLKAEADELIVQAPVMDGMPRGTHTGDPVYAAAARRERITCELDVLEEAILSIEPEYRAVIKANLYEGVPLYACKGSEVASTRTWSRKRLTVLSSIVVANGWGEFV